MEVMALINIKYQHKTFMRHILTYYYQIDIWRTILTIYFGLIFCGNDFIKKKNLFPLNRSGECRTF